MIFLDMDSFPSIDPELFAVLNGPSSIGIIISATEILGSGNLKPSSKPPLVDVFAKGFSAKVSTLCG